MRDRGALTNNFIPWRSQRAFNEFLLGNSGISIPDLQSAGYVQIPHQLGNFENQPFATSTGKIELFSEAMHAIGLDPVPDYVLPAREREPAHIQSHYPLILLTGDREKTYHHSRFREQPWAAKISPEPNLLIHPQTARKLAIADGDWVVLETSKGRASCRLRVKTSDAVTADVVSTGMGWWQPAAPGPEHGALDVNINAALSYDGPFDPASGSPDARGLLCRVRRIEHLNEAQVKNAAD
jgi:thiosulfate reductase / polysulfide reductase chain A